MDAYFAIAAAERFPDAEIWDPTNTPGMWDHTLIAAGKTALFESKGNEEGNNDILVDLDQLGDYLASGIAPLVFYLFADPPGWSDARPPIAPGAPAKTWKNFPDWAYVVPAATLAVATGLIGKYRTLRPTGGTFEVVATGDGVPCVPLCTFFDDLEECFWVARHGGRGRRLTPGRPSPQYADLPVGGHDVVADRLVRRARKERATSERRLTAIALHLPA